MMDAYLKREEEFKVHIVKSDRMIPLSPIDGKNGKGFADVLQPFLVATKIEEGEKYLTVFFSYSRLAHSATENYVILP